MNPDTPFDPATAAKKLLREAHSGALATLMAAGHGPYASLVNVATAADGSPLLLISGLAVHTKNLAADPRASLMVDERKPGDPLEGGRVSLMGVIARDDDPAIRRRYLARHPSAQMFAGFKDFAFYRMTLTGAHLVAGFGRIVDLTPGQLLADIGPAQPLLEAEEGACAHMNADHADAVRLYATKLLGAPEGDWRCVGCDPEGMDLALEQSGSRLGLRLPFPRAVHSPGVLRQVLKELAEQARAA